MLDTLDGTLHDVVSEIVSDPRKAMAGSKVVLYGPEGAGKTTAMATLHNELVARRWMAWWVDCFTFPNDFTVADEWHRILVPSPVLLLDDLGKEPDRMAEKMGRLLAARMQVRGLTFITTNLAVDEEDPDACALSQRYGRSLRSRILGNGEVVLVDGPDFRTS